MEMKEIFISYKTEDFDDAIWLKSTLENNGITCWMAPMCIPGGSSYAVEIPQAIRNCKVFVLVLSEKAQLSKWVPRELDQAINEGKIVLPFMLENCALKDDFNFYLTNVQRYAAYENKVAAVERMVREIKAILGHNDLPASSHASEPADEIPQHPAEPVAKPVTPASPTVPDSKPVSDVPKPAPRVPNTEAVVSDSDSVTTKPKSVHSAKRKSKKSSLLWIILSSIGALFIAIVAGVILIVNSMYVDIAGERVNKNDTFLEIDSAAITEQDIENIRQIKELRSVHFVNCTFPSTDLSFLSSEDLYSLTLDSCSITDEHLNSIDFSVSVHLSSVDLRNNEITDISCMAGLEDLYSVNLSDNDIVSIEALSSSMDLNWLYVSGNKLENLDGLFQAIKLTSLDAKDNCLTDISGLANSTLLRDIYLSGNNISDISVLDKYAEKVKVFHISGNPINSFDTIGKMKNLNTLRADNCGLTSIDGINVMVNLVDLSLSGNKLTTLPLMTDLGILKYIDLSDNELYDISALDDIVYEDAYAKLDLSNNNITELHLPTVYRYTYLSMHSNPISDYSALKAASGSYLALNYFDGVADCFTDNSFTEYAILECPLDKQVSVEDALGFGVSFIESVDEVSPYK